MMNDMNEEWWWMSEWMNDEWVMNDDWYVWPESHTFTALIIYMRQSTPCTIYNTVMSRLQIRRATHVNKPWHTFQWVTSRHAYTWVMSRVWMRHVTHVNTPWHTYKWIMSCIEMSHVTRVTSVMFHMQMIHTKESRHTYKGTWQIHVMYVNEACNTQ